MKNKLLSIVVAAALLTVSGCTSLQTPGSASGWLYVVTPSELYQVWFPQGQPDRRIGPTQDASGQSIKLLDIALNPKDGELYGVNDTLYRVDKGTATLTRIGSGLNILGPGAASETVALAFSRDGVLYAGLAGDTLAVIDPVTGKGTAVGKLGIPYAYSGDLAFAPDGRLFASASGSDINDELLVVNPQTGAGTVVGSIGYRKVFGLQFVGQTLYGVTEGSPSLLISIDTTTGQGRRVRELGFPGYGAQGRR